MAKKQEAVEKIRELVHPIIERAIAHKWITLAVVLIDTVVVYLASRYLPLYPSIIVGVTIIFGSFLFIYYYKAIKRLGIIPVPDDLTFILIHLRCLVTGNPPLTLMFKYVGETPLYSKYYQNLFKKLQGLIGQWGYSAPEALRLVAREVKYKVDEMFLQRLSAIVATGGDIKEYLRIEYNTLFSEYISAYNRLIESLRVVLGIYVTLLGALVFMQANLILLGMIFGGIQNMMITSMLATGVTLSAMAILLRVFVRKPLFEAKPQHKPLILKIISIGGLVSSLVFAVVIVYLSITMKILDVTEVSKYLILSGLVMMPIAILIKIHESRINEYDMFFPAFIRSYGEHLSVVPSLIEALKPLLIAELGKLKNLLRRFYVRLINRIDPRIAWRYFAEESCSEFISRSSHIFIDTIEAGGNTREAGATLSNHINELYRLRINYAQVFKTFEATLYIMHIATILILMLITNFVTLFSSIITHFAVQVPPEFADLFTFFNIREEDVSLLTNIMLVIITFANTITLTAVNPGSRYAVFYYLGVMLLLTGLGMYVSTYVTNYFINTILGPTLSTIT